MKVSICTATYNQEKFIAQAIDSVINQKVNFDYELIIGEDFSTDGTRQIVLEYQKKFLDKIKLILNKENIGSKNNFNNVYNQCEGEYIAWLDGDDYWTDMNKLQIQADYLDNNPDCSLCFHDINFFYENGDNPSYLFPFPPLNKDKLTTEDLLQRNFIGSCSVMYRAGCVKKLPDWVFAPIASDWPINIAYSLKGKLGYIRETMSAYRIHSLNEHSSKSTIKIHKEKIKALIIIDKELNYKYKKIIHQSILEAYYIITKELFKRALPRTFLFVKNLRDILRK